MKKIIVPEDISEIKLNNYQSYARDLKEDMSDDDLHFHAVSTLCEGDTDSVSHLDAKSIHDIGKYIIDLLGSQSEVIYQFNLRGCKYGLIPHLHEITTREYLTLMEFIDQGQDENLHHVMAILFRPVVQELHEKYKVSDEYYSEERAELFRKELTMNIVQGCMLFFSAITTTFWSDSPSFSKEVQATKEQVKQSVSVGTTSRTRPEMETITK